jgi:hypothetical protein
MIRAGVGRRAGSRGERAHGDDIGVAHDGVGKRKCEHDLELERRDVPVHCDFFERIQEAEVALSGRLGRGGDCQLFFLALSGFFLHSRLAYRARRSRRGRCGRGSGI